MTRPMNPMTPVRHGAVAVALPAVMAALVAGCGSLAPTYERPAAPVPWAFLWGPAASAPWAVPLIATGLATGYYQKHSVLSAGQVLRFMIFDTANPSSVGVQMVSEEACQACHRTFREK